MTTANAQTQVLSSKELGNSKRKPKRDDKQPPIKRHLTEAEITAIFNQFKNFKNSEHVLLFRFILATGAKMRESKNLCWGELNCNTGRVTFKNRVIYIPETLAKDFLAYRDKIAISEDQSIFESIYRENWRTLQTALDRLGITTKYAWLAVRYSYIARFMALYGDKKRLQKQLGLASLRWIPKYLLETKTKPVELFTKEDIERLSRPMTEQEKREQDEFFGWTEADKALIDKFDSGATLTEAEEQALDELEERNWEAIGEHMAKKKSAS